MILLLETHEKSLNVLYTISTIAIIAFIIAISIWFLAAAPPGLLFIGIIGLAITGVFFTIWVVSNLVGDKNEQLLKANLCDHCRVIYDDYIDATC